MGHMMIYVMLPKYFSQLRQIFYNSVQVSFGEDLSFDIQYFSYLFFDLFDSFNDIYVNPP